MIRLSALFVATLVLFGLLALPDMALAQRFDVYTNPALVSLTTVNAGIDLRLGKRVTAGPYGAYSSTTDDKGTNRFWGLGARTDLYLTGAALDGGWYASPFVSRYQFDVTVKGDDELKAGALAFAATNLGATFGYAFVGGDDHLRAFVRLGLGAMYTRFDGQTEVERTDGTHEKTPFAAVEGILPSGDIHVGLVF